MGYSVKYKKQQKGNMARIRLNQEYRNKIANRLRVHLEQENTTRKGQVSTSKRKS